MGLCINPDCLKSNQDNMFYCQNCGSKLLLNQRYRVKSLLEKGGMGVIYEVLEDKIEQVATKIVKVLYSNHPRYVEFFQREARVLSMLNHSGIPKADLNDYFTYQPNNFGHLLHCLVMQKIEGCNLEVYMNNRKTPVEEKCAIEWLIQLADILEEIHNKNLFHRDIKPSNIMLKTDGQLMLIDFGSARPITETYLEKQSEGKVTGIVSIGYTPMEQIKGKAVPQSDFFSLGATFVYLLTGKHPVEFYDSYTDTLKWRDAEVKVSASLADFIDYMIAPRPSQRPRTAEQIKQHLAQIYRNL